MLPPLGKIVEYYTTRNIAFYNSPIVQHYHLTRLLYSYSGVAAVVVMAVYA